MPYWIDVEMVPGLVPGLVAWALSGVGVAAVVWALVAMGAVGLTVSAAYLTFAGSLRRQE